MTDPLSTARALLANHDPSNISGKDAVAAWNLLPELIDQAERWQAMLIEERATRVAYENNMQLCECRDFAVCYARRELAAEASAWRKIDPATQDALKNIELWMTGHLPEHRNWMPEALAVLRKLLGDGR